MPLIHQALSYMRRSSSVTVLNGNIHQTMRKVEGNVQFSHGVADCFSAAAPGTPVRHRAQLLFQLVSCAAFMELRTLMSSGANMNRTDDTLVR